MAKEAAPLVEKENPVNPLLLAVRFRLGPGVRRAQLYALQQEFAAAASEIAAVEIEAEKAHRPITFHHISYGIAQVRTRMGDAPRALRWLQITVDAGWPNYPMMARDRWLDPVRNDPAVAKFLDSLKKTWENNKSEFGDEDRPDRAFRNGPSAQDLARTGRALSARYLMISRRRRESPLGCR